MTRLLFILFTLLISLFAHPQLCEVEFRTCSQCPVVLSSLRKDGTILSARIEIQADAAGCASTKLPQGSTVNVQTRGQQKTAHIPRASKFTFDIQEAKE